MTRARRRGRRVGSPDTKALILDTARRRFAEQGYGGTSMRAIAAEAGVDPALIHHYFAGKRDLFIASLRLDVDPEAFSQSVADGSLSRAGERMMRAFTRIWEDPVARERLLALVKGIGDPEGQDLLRDWLIGVVLEPLGERLGIDHARLRMSWVATQLVGIVVVRYVLEVDPLAASAPESLVATYAPTIQRYLETPIDASHA